MALNPEIALNVQTPDIGGGIMRLAQVKRQKDADQMAMQDRQIQTQAAQQQLQAGQMELDRARFEEGVMQSAAALPLLEAGDYKGAQAVMSKFRQDMAASNRPTDDIDEALQLLNTDPQQLTAVTRSLVEQGRNMGILQAPKEAEGFTLNPGDTRFDAQGNVIASVAGEKKPPETRVLKSGSREITQEFDPSTGAWRDIAETDRVAVEREIASGKQDVKNQLAEKKQGLQEQAKEIRANIVSGKVDDAIKLIDDWFTTGFFGQLLSNVGGTDARNLQSTLNTIKANLGFAELQAMRDASPTGGALGQVAIQELEMLQSTIASLDQAQDDATLKGNLKAIKLHMNNWKNAVDESLIDQKENDDDSLINKYIEPGKG